MMSAFLLLYVGVFVGVAIMHHHYALHTATHLVQSLAGRMRARVAMAVVVTVLAHLAEIVWFGLGWWGLLRFELVALSIDAPTLTDAFYFSGVTYTSLGYGEVVPVGPGRLFAVLEAVAGLVLIAWTASFTYLMMDTHWTAKGDSQQLSSRRPPPRPTRAARPESARS